MRVINTSRELTLATRVWEATTFARRLQGLMFRTGLRPGEGLLIQHCRAVHTHFMRFPIDVLFLDRNGKVLHLVPAMKPWCHSPYVAQAEAVLELAAGAAGPTAAGDQLVLQKA